MMSGMNMKQIIRTQPYPSPCGELLLGSMGGLLCLCDWQTERHHDRVKERLRNILNAEMEKGPSAVIEKAARQLDEYFARKRTEFSVPLLLVGTDFQKTVWQALTRIPYGQTISYAELARSIARPKAVRAAASAIGANALSVFVPCHRVIGSNHTLTGYAGGVEAKRWLLETEGVSLKQ